MATAEAVSLTITITIRPSVYRHGHETRRICGVAVLDTNTDSCEFNEITPASRMVSQVSCLPLYPRVP